MNSANFMSITFDSREHTASNLNTVSRTFPEDLMLSKIKNTSQKQKR